MARTKTADRHAELSRRYAETLALLQVEEETVQELRERGDLGSADGADVATSRIALDEQVMLASTLRAQLVDLQAAMQRCEAGTYGRCDRCQEPIPAARLTIFPASAHCVPCQAIIER